MTSETERAHPVPTELGAIEGIRYYAAALVRTERGRWAITVSLLVSILDSQLREPQVATWAGDFQVHVAIFFSAVAAGLFLFLLDFVDEETGRWKDVE